jgi:quercetin dioxygenase-like cupin family protein
MSRPKAAMIRENDRPTIQRGGGAVTTQMVTPECGAGALLAGFTTLPPGTAIPLHFHNCEETVLVLEGSPQVEVDGALSRVSPGEVVWQAPEIPHRFINDSETDTVRIYWTYASAEATRTLVETGEVGRVLAE